MTLQLQVILCKQQHHQSTSAPPSADPFLSSRFLSSCLCMCMIVINNVFKTPNVTFPSPAYFDSSACHINLKCGLPEGPFHLLMPCAFFSLMTLLGFLRSKKAFFKGEKKLIDCYLIGYSFNSPMEHFVFPQELTVNFRASIMCSDRLISDSVKLIPAGVSSTVAWNHDVLFIQTRGKESFLPLHRSDLYFLCV